VTEFDWREEPVPAALPVRQVHGWLVNETGRFLLRDDVGGMRFQLADGKRENADRRGAHTLLRESAEECQVALATDSIAYLGHQVVTGDPQAPGPYAQVRLFGVIQAFGLPAADPFQCRRREPCDVPCPLVLYTSVSAKKPCSSPSRISASRRRCK
jgi:hypothetical protein